MTDQPQDPAQPKESAATPEQPPESAATPEQTGAPGTPDQAESDRISRLRARSVASETPTPPPPVEPTRPPSTDAPPPRFAPPEAPAPITPPSAPAPTVPRATTPTGYPTAYDAPRMADATAGEAAPARGGGWAPDSPRMVVAVATAVLAATATALAGLVTSHVSSVNAVESTRSDVVGAATSGVATVLSYDYRHLDTDFSTAERLLTPHFRKQYDDTTAKGVKPLAAKYRAISSAEVSAAGVVEADSDRAVVLVFVNQTVTNSQLTAPRLDRSRIDVTLVRSNGHWLIDKLTTL